jgi:hypothetical protein
MNNLFNRDGHKGAQRFLVFCGDFLEFRRVPLLTLW